MKILWPCIAILALVLAFPWAFAGLLLIVTGILFAYWQAIVVVVGLLIVVHHVNNHTVLKGK